MNVLEKTEKISRFFGYRDCLKSASNYKFFVNWYRKMKFREFEAGIKIPALRAVEDAIKRMLIILTEYEENVVTDLRYSEGEILVAFHNGEIVPISYLSDGYQDVIGIVSDIAYRMAILNPNLGEDILDKTPGIVLIDEIEVHLHPRWQQKILNGLKDIFPSVQFIVTTHSPMIVGSTLEDEAIELIREDGRTVYHKVGNPKEWYMADILRNVFGIKERVNKDSNKSGETLEDRLRVFSGLVKKYTYNKDEECKREAIELYDELIRSVPEGNPRRSVLDRLKGLIE